MVQDVLADDAWSTARSPTRTAARWPHCSGHTLPPTARSNSTCAADWHWTHPTT